MNPLVNLISLFAAMKSDLSARFNAALQNRPPLESVEGSNVAISVLRELDWAKERIERLGTELNATLSAASAIIPGFEYQHGEPVETAATRLIEKFGDDSATKAISTAIAAKTHLPMDDHKTALENAVTAAQAEAQQQATVDFQAKLDEIKTLAERRTAAMEKLGSAASSLSDADLLAEDHEARLTAIEGRVAQLASAGITAESKPLSFASLMACAMDEAGNKEFEVRLETIKEASGTLAMQASTTTTPKPSTPAGTLSSGNQEGKKKFVI